MIFDSLHGAFRDQQGLFRCARGQTHPGGHPRHEAPVGVGDDRAAVKCAGGGIEPDVDRIDLTAPRVALLIRQAL